MRELFDYFGQTETDVAFDAALTFSYGDPIAELRNMDRVVVILAKVGNLHPGWVEEQDIVRQNRLLSVLLEFVELQRQSFESKATDNKKEWL